MATNDIILHQLDATPDFNERTVSAFAQGSLIIGDASGFPSKLAIGTNGHILQSNGTTASWVAQSAGHTQNTDTGTTELIFHIDSDGYDIELTAQSATKFGVLQADGSTYADLQAKDITADNFVAGTTTVGVADTVATTINAFGAATTANIGYDGTAAATINIGAGATATATTKVLNIGTGGATGSTTNINLGSANGGTVTVNKDLVVTGDLTVNGTTTTINSTTLQVDDKNIEIGLAGTPTDITADGGGITLKGDTDKTITWDNTNDNWTLNQNVNIPTGTVYKINNVALAAADVGAASAYVTAPVAYNSTGTAGQVAWDGDYVYRCVATDSWRRAPMAKWA